MWLVKLSSGQVVSGGESVCPIPFFHVIRG